MQRHSVSPALRRVETFNTLLEMQMMMDIWKYTTYTIIFQYSIRDACVEVVYSPSDRRLTLSILY